MALTARRALLGTLAGLIITPIANKALADAPSKVRPPMQAEFERCALWAEEHGDHSMSGRLRLELLIRKTGNVYGAFVWSEMGIDNRRFERCLTSAGPLWVFPQVAIDYSRAFSPSFIHSSDEVNPGLHNGQGISGQSRASVFLPDVNDLPDPTPLNIKVAQETLEVADWATLAERATAEVAVRNYPASLEHARAALAQNQNDAIALRALSQALAESGGDMVEARRHAERLVGIDPQSVDGHEALLRVCLAAKDDACALEEWNKARKAPDMQPRSRLLADLQGPTQLAVERLKRLATSGSTPADTKRAGDGQADALKTGEARAEAAQPADPCAAEQGDAAQALCVVKRCLDEGSAAYAKELSSQNGVPYAAGDWRVKPVAAGKLLVTRPIEVVPGKPGEPVSEAVKHDALWLVNVGDQLIMRPTNTEARQITVRHNRCTARVVTGAR